MGTNKKILSNVLRGLPGYSPDNKVWENISKHLEKGHIPKLSQVEPPSGLWDKIDNELTHQEKITALKKYNPPEKVWNHIDRKLSSAKENRKKRGIIKLVQWSSAAAAILLLGFVIFTSINTTDKKLSYSEEWQEVIDIQKWLEDDKDVDRVLNLICTENPKVCNSPEFKKMESDLVFLNKSKDAILNQLNKYSANVELEKTLMEIEFERTNLIKEMISKSI